MLYNRLSSIIYIRVLLQLPPYIYHMTSAWTISIIFQTPKNVQNMFDFNMTSNPHGYLALFVPKTLLVV